MVGHTDLIRPELYPPLCHCTEIIGEVTPRAASDTGLPEGTAVVAGGEDTPAAALSVGVSEPGDAFLSLGTAAVVGVCLEDGKNLKEPRLLTYPHVLPGLSIYSGSMSSAGGAVEWLLREFRESYGKATDYSALNQAVEASPPGANGLIFLPYLSGELPPILDANARGVFFGLSTETTRADVARAVIEGSAMAIRHNLCVAERAGAPAGVLRASGGPTNSAAWCQAIADVTGQTVQVVRGGGAPVGDVLVAGAGVGLIPNPGELARSIVAVEREYEPSAEYRARYDHAFEAYLRIYEHLVQDFKFMAECPLVICHRGNCYEFVFI